LIAHQNTNKQATSSFSGTDVLRIILKRWKLIVCISLIAAILVGAGMTFMQLNSFSYGNTVDFYLSKTDETKFLLPMLQSESFAEKLLLDEYGLPEEYAGKNDTDYEKAKAAVIKFRQQYEVLKKTDLALSRIDATLTTPKDPVTGETISSFAIIQTEYNALVAEHESLYDLLVTYKGVDAEATVNEQHLQKTAEIEAALAIARQKRDEYKALAYDPAIREKTLLSERFIYEFRLTFDLKKTADALSETVIAKWRSSPEVKDKINRVMQSLTFAYATPAESIENQVKPENADKETPNVSFLKVSVSVAKDADLANFILERLKTRLPGFAELSIDHLSSSGSAKCTLISPYSSAKRLGEGNDIAKTAVISAVVFVGVAFLIGLLAVVVELIKSLNINKPQKVEDSKKA